jgi:tetratricopeptide (TPR) repeat protein
MGKSRGRQQLSEVHLAEIPDALLREAAELRRQKRVPEAIEAYRRVLERSPGLAESWFNLAVLLRQAHRFEEALEAYQRALEAGVSSPEEAHLNRSVIYTDYLRRHADAERELRLALALNPAFTPALLNLGNLCEDLGRRDEALMLYARILGREPRCFEALARYANMQTRQSAAPALVARLQEALGDPTASAAERANLGFAHGRLLDQAGEHRAAFAAYRAANQASRASGPAGVRYDRVLHHEFIDRLIAHGIPSQQAAPVSESAGPQPIFICGMFRSGSTLTEQLLAGSAHVAAGGEIDFLPHLVGTELAPFPESLARISAARLSSLAARYRRELIHVSSHARYVTDKRPDNFLYIGLIKSLFPDAKIVHTVRNPLDNCLSIYFLHLDLQMSYALDLMDIGHYFAEYRRLMAHWKTHFAADIFDFDYDALVKNPPATLQRLHTFLGLEQAGPAARMPAAPEVIKTASAWQVREPLYETSSGRARHYASELQELREYLGEVLPA